jgi:YD repeat-containing protein
VYVGGKQYVLSVWIFIQSTSTYRLKWGEQVSPPSGFTPPTYGDHALLDNPSITGGAWHQVCLPWTPSANISGSEIVFTIEWDDGHFVFLDDLQLWGEPGVPAEQVLGTGSGTYGNNPSRLEAEPVNTATGNYVSHATDLALPGVGLPLVFSRTYNSLDPTVGALGVGWTHSYAAHLELEGSGAVRFFAGDGAQLLFTPDGSGGFIRPSGAYTDLEPLIDGTYELTRRDQVVEHFDADGLLLSQTDRNGNALTFSYTNDLLTAITDTVGRGVSLTYDGSNRLTSLGAPLSRSVTYTYDGSGRLSTVTDLAGETTTYGYDTSDRLTTITDANNHV